jgi:hypothetical protein
MNTLLEDMKELRLANPQHYRYCNGYASIGFRTADAGYVINHDNFILNSKNDGWFRKDYGIAKGHGLCINDIKITSRVPILVGDFICYKAVIQYTNNDFEPKEETDKFWVIVHKRFDIKDVMEYIQENKENWRA